MIEKIFLEITVVRGRICSLYPTCKPPRGTRKCRIPRSPEGQIPPIAGEMSQSDKGGAGPAGPHDTLQPPDESIIVGYYTLKKCRSLRFPNLAAVYQQKGALWQETTGLTVP